MKETRLLLLEAAAEEFAREGFDKANVNQIAKDGGFSIGTLYNYFSTKRELMNTLIDETAKKHVAYMIDQVKLVEDPKKRVIAFYKAGFEFIEMNFYHSVSIFITLNSADKEFKIRIFQGYQPLFAFLIDEVINLGISTGAFHPVDTDSTAGLLMLLYLGAGSQYRINGNLRTDHTQIADFVLRSLCKK